MEIQHLKVCVLLLLVLTLVVITLTGVYMEHNKIYKLWVFLSENKQGECAYSNKSSDTGKHGTVSNCHNLSVPCVNQSDNSWQSVSERHEMFLYSAFLDTGKVWAIGIKSNVTVQLTCQMWYRNETTDTVVMETTPAVTEWLRGRTMKIRYNAAYVICDFQHSWSPFAVSIVDGNTSCSHPINAFHIHKHHSAIAKRFNFTICIPPVRSRHGYPSVHSLVEWIEINRLLGVEFFTFYNESMDIRVGKILKQYERQGVVEILRWNCPTHEVHYSAQSSSMHDCLHRHHGRATLTAFQDLDEIIIPRHPKDLTWTDMFKRLPAACSYSFQSSSFVNTPYIKDGDSVDPYFIANHSVVLNHLRRHSIIFPHHTRSKVIVRPDEVSSIGVHLTFACKNLTIYNASPDIGMVHHYRKAPGKHDVWDNTTLKFRSGLVERLHKILLK